MQGLARGFGEISVLVCSVDALGPFAVITLQLDPLEVKKRCIHLESLTPQPVSLILMFILLRVARLTGNFSLSRDGPVWSVIKQQLSACA